MNKKLSMATATGAMQILASIGSVDCAMMLGSNEEDYNLLIGNRPWVGSDIPRIRRLMDGILNGVVDVCQIPRFDLPAEYMASAIALFVNPVNYMSACHIVGSAHSADEMARPTGSSRLEESDKVQPRQLFSLVCEIYSGGSIERIAKDFESKTERALAFVQPVKGNHETENE